MTHVDWKLAAYPHELSRIDLELLNAAQMRLSHIDSISPQHVNHLQIVLEHVRVLVIFGVYVLPDRRRERDLQRPAERDAQDIAGWAALQKAVSTTLEAENRQTLNMPYVDMVGAGPPSTRHTFRGLRIANVVERKRQNYHDIIKAWCWDLLLVGGAFAGYRGARMTQQDPFTMAIVNDSTCAWTLNENGLIKDII